MLDPRTLLFAGGIGQALAAFLLVGIACVHRRDLAARYWAIAYSVLALSAPLFLLRGIASDWISVVLANTMAVVASFLIHAGVASFEQKRRSGRLGVVVSVAVAAGCAYWTFISPHIGARVVVVNTGFIISAALIARDFLLGPPRPQPVLRALIGGLFLVLAGCCLYRVLENLVKWNVPETSVYDMPLLAMWLALTFGLVFLSATGFMMLTQFRLQARLDRLANHDALTGLLNRRAYRRGVVRALRSGVHGHLLLLDMDHFKSLNDQFGHVAGDRALRALAEIIQRNLPAGAAAGRLGGDEFSVLLPASSADDAQHVAEAIRASTKAWSVAVGDLRMRISISVGIAALAECRSFNDALRQADVALYDAKSAGRDTVVSMMAA